MPRKKRKPTKQIRTKSPDVALSTSHEDLEKTAENSKSEQADHSSENEQGQHFLNVSAVKLPAFSLHKTKTNQES